MINGKRTPVGEVIKNYFPQIISEKLFYQVQETIKANREMQGNGGGKVGKVKNLFSLVGKCGTCGSSLAFVGSGKYEYVVCNRARHGKNCQEHRHIDYREVEKLLLIFCKNLNVSDILPNKKRSELFTLRSDLQGVEGELAQVQRKIDNLLRSLEESDTPAFVTTIKERVNEYQTHQAELTKQSEELRVKITRAAGSSENTQKQLSSIRELIEKMQGMTGQEKIDLRLSLRNQVRRLINRIDFFPDKHSVIFTTGERRLLVLRDNMVAVHDCGKLSETSRSFLP